MYMRRHKYIILFFTNHTICLTLITLYNWHNIMLLNDEDNRYDLDDGGGVYNDFIL